MSPVVAFPLLRRRTLCAWWGQRRRRSVGASTRDTDVDGHRRFSGAGHGVRSRRWREGVSSETRRPAPIPPCIPAQGSTELLGGTARRRRRGVRVCVRVCVCACGRADVSLPVPFCGVWGPLPRAIPPEVFPQRRWCCATIEVQLCRRAASRCRLRAGGGVRHPFPAVVPAGQGAEAELRSHKAAGPHVRHGRQRAEGTSLAGDATWQMPRCSQLTSHLPAAAAPQPFLQPQASCQPLPT